MVSDGSQRLGSHATIVAHICDRVKPRLQREGGPAVVEPADLAEWQSKALDLVILLV